MNVDEGTMCRHHSNSMPIQYQSIYPSSLSEKKCPCVLPNESTLKTTIHLLFVVCYVIFCLHNTAKRTGEKK